MRYYRHYGYIRELKHTLVGAKKVLHFVGKVENEDLMIKWRLTHDASNLVTIGWIRQQKYIKGRVV